MSKPIFGVREDNWQTHLRPDNKRVFWGKVRRIYAKKIQEEASELQIMQTLENELFQEV
jgi:hypothetical protein